MAATIRDITKMTGLSLATVSKYLNGGNVLPQNKILIEDAIEKLHYEVNEVARGLATNRTRTIGILTHRLDNTFASTIIMEIENILRSHDYGTIVCSSRGEEKLEEDAVRFLLGKRVDGIITFPTASDSACLKPALEREIPVVLIDRSFRDREMDCVLVDNEKASYQAVQRLIACGHRKIGIINGESQVYTAKKRLDGYLLAHQKAGIVIRQEYIEQGPMTDTEFAYQAMMRLLELPDPPTAVFLGNYELTLGGIIALNERGVRFPEDISIIGFDNIMISQVVKPKLWMVTQPMSEIAQRAAELLLLRLSGEKAEHGAEKIVLETQMIEGESVRRIEL